MACISKNRKLEQRDQQAVKNFDQFLTAWLLPQKTSDF